MSTKRPRIKTFAEFIEDEKSIENAARDSRAKVELHPEMNRSKQRRLRKEPTTGTPQSGDLGVTSAPVVPGAEAVEAQLGADSFADGIVNSSW